jgi:hypothetical protein
MNLSTADLRKVININVRNFKFPIGFYSNPHPLWTSKNMALTPFTTNLKTLGSTRNIYLYYFYYYYSYSFFPRSMNLSTADLRNYRTEFHETWWSYRYMFLVDPKVFFYVHAAGWQRGACHMDLCSGFFYSPFSAVCLHDMF